MKRVCRKSVFLGVVMGFLFASLLGCELISKIIPTGESKPDKTVITRPHEAPSEAPSKTPAGKGMPAKGASAKEPDVPPVTQETKTQVTYYIHTVKWSGETVSIIAGWYTNDIQNWKILIEANPDINPKAIVIGQEIRIPEHIMTTRSPMTKAHVDSYYHKSGKQKTESLPSEKKDETPSLYGPRSHPQK